MRSYNYCILVANTPDKYLSRESTYLPSPFKKTKFALIEKQVFKDGSEGINRIMYSNSYNELSDQMKKYISWYDYIVGQFKNIQGYISKTWL